MVMQQTSINSFNELDVVKIGLKQKIILDCITFFGPVGDGEISYSVGMQRSLVAARRGELVKMGFVVPDVVRVDSCTNKKVITWKVKRTK
jgi:hypothetical protein